MAGKVYGLDLGTYEIKVFDKKQDKIWREKDAIAMKNKKYIFAVGNEAYEVFEKAPVDIRVVFPMRNGVIAHFDDMQYLSSIRKQKPSQSGSWRKGLQMPWGSAWM